jgi:hypothetical protein
VAPGTATLAIQLTLSATSDEPLPLDQIINNYSPSADVTVTTASATFQAFTTLSPSITANSRGVVLIPPAGNTTVITLKGVTGDTGFLLHPNGIAVLPFSAAGVPTSGILTASSIVGLRLISF